MFPELFRSVENIPVSYKCSATISSERNSYVDHLGVELADPLHFIIVILALFLDHVYTSFHYNESINSLSLPPQAAENTPVVKEKRLLSEHLQKAFANKLLHFSVKITDNPVEFTPIEKTMSKKDQFLVMTEQYPMIKELKDRLKLDLDY